MMQAYIRLAVLVILLINQILITLGWTPIPFSEEQIYEGISSVALVGVALWNWWKNNNVTEEAQEAQIYLNELKSKKNIDKE